MQHAGEIDDDAVDTEPADRRVERGVIVQPQLDHLDPRQQQQVLGMFDVAGGDHDTFRRDRRGSQCAGLERRAGGAGNTRQPRDEMGADESGPADDEYSAGLHGRLPP